MKMKQNLMYFGAITIVLIGIATWAVYGMLHIGKKADTYKVSVIVNNSNSEHWTAMREGLEQAGNDNNVELNFISTSSYLDEKEEITLLNREIDNGADGIIAEMTASDNISNELEELSNKTQLVLVNTDVLPEGVYSLVEPDYENMGRDLAEEVIKEQGENITSCKIGILCGNQKQLSMQRCLYGVKEILSEKNVEIVWELPQNGTDRYSEVLKVLNTGKVNVLITLSNDDTETAIDVLLAENNTDSKIYGVGNSEKAVYYIDKGLVHTLIVPNEFNIGYQSLEILSDKLQYKMIDENKIYVDHVVVDKNNLYDEDNQKIVFPIVQ